MEWMMHVTSDSVMSLMSLWYGTECVVQNAPFLMVWMDHLMIGMWHPFAHTFKPSVLICSRKSFMLNSLYPWYALMLNLLMCTCWRLCEVLGLSCLRSLNCSFLLWERWYWTILYAGKALHWYKNLCIVRCLYDVAICLLEEECLALYSWIHVAFHATL